MKKELENIQGSGKGKRLSMEMGSLVFLQFGSVDLRYKSKLIGMEPNVFLIVKTPASGPIEGEIFKGNSVIVRYVLSGSVYGFRSTLIGYTGGSFKLLFLSYPADDNDLEIMDLRSKPRIDCYIPCSVIFQDHNLGCIIMDISSTGCKVVSTLTGNETLQVPGIGEHLKLSFTIPGKEGVCPLQGLVKSKTQDSSKISMGLQFIRAPAALADTIDSYVREVTSLRDNHPIRCEQPASMFGP